MPATRTKSGPALTGQNHWWERCRRPIPKYWRAVLLQVEALSAGETEHILWSTAQNRTQTPRHWGWEDSKMQSSSLKPKVGMEGVCFMLEIFPKSGISCAKRMTTLPSTVVFAELSPAPCISTASLTSTACTDISGETKHSDTALLRVGLSFWRGKGPQFNCIQRRLPSPPLNFHFCYWNNNKKNQLYAQPKSGNVNNFSCWRRPDRPTSHIHPHRKGWEHQSNLSTKGL